MSIFKKKRSLEDIEKDILELSEEEKSALLNKLQGSNEEKTEEVAESEMDDGESVTENVEESESEQTEEMPVETTEEQSEEAPSEEVVESVDVSLEEDNPTEEPVEESVEEMHAQQNNYQELIEAQNSKITSLESEITALKETVEKIVSNQDNKNFGYSPSANYSNEEQSSRSEAIMRGYAPRRLENYK
jgi:hypothetical protein